MNKIVIQFKYFSIKVYQLVIGLIILLLLLFLVTTHKQDSEIIQKKEGKIGNRCEFSNSNIIDFNTLMARVDLCSKNWFKDYEAYITRINEQNKYLKKQKKKEFPKVLKFQTAFLKKLKNFNNEQDEENIDELEKAFGSYKKIHDNACMKGNMGEQL